MNAGALSVDSFARYRHASNDCRASAEGETTVSTSGADSELAYAATHAKKMTVGVNLKCSSAAGYAVTTFCEEGEAALNNAVQESQAALSTYPSLAGFAVFSYEAWLTVKP